MDITQFSSPIPLAFLIPLSQEARESLEFPMNERWRCELSSYLRLKSFTAFQSQFEECDAAIMLDFHSLRGLSSLRFGYSQANDYICPSPCDHFQFQLHFEVHTGILLISDVSDHGTFVDTYSTTQPLSRSTWPLLKSTYLRFGADTDRRYRFQIIIAEHKEHDPVYESCFQEYLSSIMLYPPLRRLQSGILSAASERPLVFADRFVRLLELGHGAEGLVHACVDKYDGSLVAVKESFQKSHGGNEISIYQDGEAEFRLLEYLAHPNVTRVIEWPGESNQPVLVTEFLSSGNLYQFIRDRHDCGLPLSLGDLREMLEQCLSALEYLSSHRVIHCDIKPENILVSQLQSPFTVKLCDFGSAILGVFVVEEGYVGTKGYIAPEVDMGTGYDARRDVWGLGIVILEVCGTVELDCVCQTEEELETAMSTIWYAPLASLLGHMLSYDWRIRYSAAQCLEDRFFKEDLTEPESAVVQPKTPVHNGNRKRPRKSSTLTKTGSNSEFKRECKRPMLEATEQLGSLLAPSVSALPGMSQTTSPRAPPGTLLPNTALDRLQQNTARLLETLLGRLYNAITG